MSDTTHVFCRVEGQLARFEVATSDPQLARQTLFDALVSSGWRGGSPVLALIRGGRVHRLEGDDGDE